MVNAKNTKKALFSSVIALILCLSMLVGTTFAWFTDVVTSGTNQIIAGNLDVELEYSKDMAEGSWKTVQGATLFDSKTLWEPGHTEVVYLKITNKGTLALKYNFSINFTDTVIGKTEKGENIKLSEHLMYAVVDVSAKYADRDAARDAVEDKAVKLTGYFVDGEMKADADAKTVALVIYMPEDVGNEANYRGEAIPTIDLGIKLVAIQKDAEYDSFGNDYDEGLEPGAKVVKDATELANAIADAEDGDTIMLGNDITYTGNDYPNITKAITLDLNGKTLSTTSLGIVAKGGCSIKNGTVVNPVGGRAAIRAWNVESIENVVIESPYNGGISIQSGDCSIKTIKNVTINSATYGIEFYRTTAAVSVKTMENVTINAGEIGIHIIGGCNVEEIKNCDITGATTGIQGDLKGLSSISLNIVDSKITGTANHGIDLWDESSVNTGSVVTLTHDDATVFTGGQNDIKITLNEEVKCIYNGEEQDSPCTLYINN